MNIVVLAAAERGIRCLEKIGQLLKPCDELTVFTFKETSWEPPFVDSMGSVTKSLNGSFHVTSKVHSDEFDQVWNNKPDIIFVIGWRYLIPESVYNSAKIGCFVFHDSFLPEYRGFGPSVWAVRNGADYTGATLFKIVEEMDAGPVLCQRRVAIKEADYISDVVNNVTLTYLDILDDLFPDLRDGIYDLVEQDHKKATYTCKSMPEDFRIIWNKPAREIRNLIRAYAPPYSGSYCYIDGQRVIILDAKVFDEHSYVGLIPGRVVKIENGVGVFVGTGEHLLLIGDVKLENGEILNSSQIVNRISLTLE